MWESVVGILTHNCVSSAPWVFALVCMINAERCLIGLRGRLPSPQFHPSGTWKVCFESSAWMLADLSTQTKLPIVFACYDWSAYLQQMTSELWCQARLSSWPFSSPVHSSCLWRLQYSIPGLGTQLGNSSALWALGSKLSLIWVQIPTVVGQINTWRVKERLIPVVWLRWSWCLKTVDPS